MRLGYILDEPALIAALTLAVCVYLPVSLFLKIVCTGGLLLLLPFAAFRPAPRLRRAYIVGVLGLLLGLQSLYRIQSSTPWTGLGGVLPAKLRVVLKEDTRRGDGYATAQVRMLRSWTREGASVRASGETRLVFQSERLLGRGSVVDVKALQRRQEFTIVELVGEEGFQYPLWEWRWKLHTRSAERIAMLPRRSSSLLRALLLGVSDDIDPSLREQFRDSGNMHVLALSGMHLALISALCMGLFRRLSDRRSAAFLMCVVLTLYLFVVGFRPSLLRAYLMVLFYVISSAAGRRISAMSILSLTMLVMSLIAPLQLTTLSFQLSFLALFGILFWTPLLQRRFAVLPSGIATPFFASFGALIMNAPLLLSHFEQLPLGGLLWSSLVGLLAAMFLWGGLLVLLFPSLAVFLEALYVAIDWTTYLAAFSPALRFDEFRIGTLLGIASGAAILLWCLASPAPRRVPEKSIGVSTFLSTRTG